MAASPRDKAGEKRRFTILYDLDDTLIPNCIKYHAPAWRCGLIISKKLGLASPYPVEVLAMHQREQMAMVERKGFTIDVFPKSWVRTYEKLCKESHVPVSAAVSKRLFYIAGHFADGPYWTFPGVKTALKYLKSQGHPQHLITAGAEELQLRKVSEAGLDAIFDSVNVTLRDKKAIMARLAGRRRQDCLMVGDSRRSDIGPAKELGITTVLVPSRTWGYAAADVEPDYTIESVRDLPQLLESLLRNKKKG